MASSTAAATSPFLGNRLPEHSLAKAVDRFQAQFGFGSKKAKAPPTSDRPLWFPRAKASECFVGSLVGDYGFDPFGLGKPVEYLQFDFDFDLLDQNLAKNTSGDVVGTRTESADVKSTPFEPYSKVFGLLGFCECELIHGRWAMLATLGALAVNGSPASLGRMLARHNTVELVEGSSYLGLPLPFNITTLIWIEVLVIGYIEFQRNTERDPERRLYQGGRPREEGLPAAGRDQARPPRHGRLPGLRRPGRRHRQGPLNNWATHLSDPLHTTIIDTFAFSS
ncbi:hypothetical protein BHM03_00051647 [Ensete ventricosum]|nr:hypothetical protein BHM03_00051647 [Ensete ventricosum]